MAKAVARIFAIVAAVSGSECVLRSAGGLPMMATDASGGAAALDKFKPEADVMCASFGTQWAIAEFRRVPNGVAKVEIQ